MYKKITSENKIPAKITIKGAMQGKEKEYLWEDGLYIKS